MTSIDKEKFFEEYRILNKVGEGGYGSVFRIINKEGNPYALKTIMCPSLNILSASLDEIMSILKVNNPAAIIVKHHLMDRKDIPYANGQLGEAYILGIVMEYAESSLFEDMNRRRIMKRFYRTETVYKLLKTFVNLLADFQAISIAHRDLKPENILLTKTGFKLTDFGLAKTFDSPRSNSYAGSPYYVAPKLREAMEKDRLDLLDHNVFKSDVFSLGLNVLEAATLCEVKSLNSVKFSYRIKEILARMKEDYEDWFVEVLGMMLEFKEEIRPDFVALRKIIESKDKKTDNPFQFLNNYLQDVYSYIKESEEKKALDLQKDSQKEKVYDFYENFLVKKNNNDKFNLPVNLTQTNEKKFKVLYEIAEQKTEKKKDNQEDLSQTRRISVAQSLNPVLLQEHKVFFFLMIFYEKYYFFYGQDLWK